MAASESRTTYALDEETVRRLAHLARRWNMSPSDALKQAIQAADSDDKRIAALDALQASMKLSPEAAESWASQVRDERRRTRRPAIAR